MPLNKATTTIIISHETQSNTYLIPSCLPRQYLGSIENKHVVILFWKTSCVFNFSYKKHLRRVQWLMLFTCVNVFKAHKHTLLPLYFCRCFDIGAKSNLIILSFCTTLNMSEMFIHFSCVELTLNIYANIVLPNTTMCSCVQKDGANIDLKSFHLFSICKP